jgi:gas vesicle protein GvpN
MLIFGDDEFKTSDLIGNQTGYTRKKVVDNYIHSVVKVEDELRQNWVDSRLTLACREGFTLVYDEFNRSRPEVNNVLLSALEEKLLVLPPSGNRNEYIRVSPHFRAIFTSNPEEYCGVHETQDALLDRLVTINMPEPDELTQQEIVVQKTSIDRESAAIIVSLVKAFRIKTGAEKTSGLRSCLMVGKVCHEHEILVMPENPEFRDICHDVLLSRTGRSLTESTQLLWELFNELICPELDPADLLEDCDLSQPETLIFSPQSQAHPEVEVLSGELTKQPALSNGNKQDESSLEIDELLTLPNTESSVPFEWEVYEYLQEFQDARIAQIEAALGINRYEVVTALRSLTEQGVEFNSSIAETISAYQIHITSEDEV